MILNQIFDLRGQNQAQRTGTGYRPEITLARVENGFKGHVGSMGAQTTMTIDMKFDLQGQIQGQRTGYQIPSRSYVSTHTKMVSSDS